MDTRKKVGYGGIGLDLMSGAALAWLQHQWLWVPFALGAVIAVWGLWPRSTPETNEHPVIDNSGAFAGRDNTGTQQVFHGPVTIHHAAPRAGDVGGVPGPTLFEADTGGKINAENAEIAPGISRLFSGAFAKASTGGHIHMPGIKVRDVGDGTFRVEVPPVIPNRIPLHEAAIRLYEAEEQEGVQEDPLPSSLSPADRILEHCKYVLLTAAREERIVLWGTRPPSRNSTKIQAHEIAHYLPAPGSSRLNPAFATGAAIIDVCISEAELLVEINARVDLLKRLGGSMHSPRSIPPEPDNDTWVQDAILFAINRVWPQENDQLKEGQASLASDALQRMRELAGKGKFIIWGRETKLHLPIKIPQTFWVDNQVHYLSAIFAEADETKTETATYAQTKKTYTGLQVSKQQMEEFWPPH